MTAGQDAGVVNPAFNVEFSSEDEHSSSEESSMDVPNVNGGGTTFEGKSEFSDTFTDSSSSSHSPEHTISRPVRETTAASGGIQAVQEMTSSHANSGNYTGERNNVQKQSSMQETNNTFMVTESTPVPNRKGSFRSGISERIGKTGSIIENGFAKDFVVPKAYYRDVRLSLDASKGGDVTSFQDHSYCVQSSYDASTIDSSSSDSSCDNCCSGTIKKYYKVVLQYVVERPLFCFAVWAMFYILWGDTALPGGSLFSLIILELVALCLGYVAELLQLPGLLGMMAAGFILRNVPHIDVAKDIDASLLGPMRGVSIVILLVKGALGVNAVNIVKFKNIVPTLVIGSCVLEAIAATIAVHLIVGFPIEWAFLMGCIMSAMSGVAVLPYLASTEKALSLKADPCTCTPNYQRVIAVARTACGLDAILAICLAEVALGFIYSEGKIGKGLLLGLAEVGMGGVFGIIWGFLVGGLMDETSSNEKRVLAVFAGSVMSLLGFTKVGYPRGGPLATFVGVLIVATMWRKRKIGGNNNEQLSASFTLIWYLFQPLLFSIIAARTDFGKVDWNTVALGLSCLAISLAVRIITSFLTTHWGKLSIRERLYICVAWLPKGTVQAALGPVVLDTFTLAKNLSPDIDYKGYGFKVMNISAASVVATATIGCLLLRFVGPRLLVSK